MTARIDVTRVGVEMDIVESVVELPQMDPERSYIVSWRAPNKKWWGASERIKEAYGRVYPDCFHRVTVSPPDSVGDVLCRRADGVLQYCGTNRLNCPANKPRKDDYTNPDELWMGD